MGVRLPMPPMKGMGMRKPKRARLGMVWKMLAMPSAMARRAGRWTMNMPRGTPMRIAMAIAILIGVPLGMFIVHRPALRAIALGIASIFQTIPSLALFGFLIPIPFIGGIGKRTPIAPLVLYALLPILRDRKSVV